MQDKIPAKFKTTPEDFIVEEIARDYQCTVSIPEQFTNKPNLDNLDTTTPKDFLIAELEKKNIDQFRAKRELASQIHKGIDAISFAGTKDKQAITSQRVSIFTPDINLIKNFTHPHLYLKNFAWSKRKIKLGFLSGNKFTVTLRDIDNKNAIKIANQIKKTMHFNNYFGKQRFGSVRGNNAKIGYLITQKKYEQAINEILTHTSKKEQKEVTEARLKLQKELADKNPNAYSQALEYFPQYLRFERSILGTLKHTGNNYIRTIIKSDRKQFLMFIHALQSKLFNEILDLANDEEVDFTKKGQRKIPLFGYKSKIDEGKLGEIEEEVLQYNKLQLNDFRNDDIKYLSLKGDYRDAIVNIEMYDIQIEDDEVNNNTKKIILKFSLPSGVYATTFLQNFFELEEAKCL